jgi:hypothetical protein
MRKIDSRVEIAVGGQASVGEEGVQLGVGLVRRLLGQVVAAVEHTSAHFIGPPAPDVQETS